MKMRDAAEVTLSVMGVFQLVHAAVRVPNLGFVFRAFYQARPYSGTPYTLLLRDIGGFSVDLVAGILLVLLAHRIADWLTRRSASAASADVDLRIVSRERFRFCLKFVGIFSLIKAVPMLVEWEMPGIAIPGAAALALAIYLICGGGWLTRFAWGKAEA